MARAAGHGVEQHQTAVRTRVGGHHKRSEFAAVEAQELRSRQTKRMRERCGHREVRVHELWDVDDRNIRDLPSGQHLTSEIVLVLLSTNDPLRTVRLRCKLQWGVLLVGLGQVIGMFEGGQFAFGVATVQADGEASAAQTGVDDQ